MVAPNSRTIPGWVSGLGILILAFLLIGPVALAEGFDDGDLDVAVPACDLIPGVLDFGICTVGSQQSLNVEVHNTGTFPFLFHPSLVSPHFHMNATATLIEPGGAASFTITYRPLAAGYHDIEVDLGNSTCPPLFLTATAEADLSQCGTSPGQIDFGDVILGTSAQATVRVENLTGRDMPLEPTVGAPGFTITGGASYLRPHMGTTFLVTFTPQAIGEVDTWLAPGGICPNVKITANAITDFGSGENLVGVYFDQDFQEFETNTETDNMTVTCYVVMHNPSEPSGVGAWELAFDLIGESHLLRYDLAGSNINAGTDQEFIVGIGSQPLLPDNNGAILLGSFQLLISRPYPNEVTVLLEPIRQPSLNGLMSWIAWDDPERLIPLIPITGQWAVGWVNAQPVAARNIPAPRIQLQGRVAILEWPVPEGISNGAGFHVYRRLDGAGPTRLTTVPVSTSTSTLVFTDRWDGPLAANVVAYSYGLVENGIETLRSPETEIFLSGVPSAGTRLLGNVPNPFNPSTEIRFELARGQTVQLSIYDVNGRLVRNLLDGFAGPGPNQMVWDGRDDQGRQAPSGAYYARLVTETSVDHLKMLLLK